MRRYLLTDEAKADLAEIKNYLRREAGSRVAKSALDKIKEAMALLARMPNAGHLREDLTDEPVKFWSVYSYLIIYDPATKPVEILRVIHGNREVSVILAPNNLN